MKYTFEKAEKSTVKITIDLTAKEWQSAIDLAYDKTKGRYSMPGFRKGKVPQKVLENALDIVAEELSKLTGEKEVDILKRVKENLSNFFVSYEEFISLSNFAKSAIVIPTA